MPEYLHDLIRAISAGGPVMAALALVSILLYKHTIGLFLFVRGVDIDTALEANGNGRADEPYRPASTPAAAAGVPRITARMRRHYGTRAHDPLRLQVKTYDETILQLKQLIRSRLKYANALLVAAPLLGLLGTVMGMLDTFHGMSLQLGSETARTVSDGISRALITTQTGLMIAIPALFLIHWIKRETQRRELDILERKMHLLSRIDT
ncbi:MAG: MotA/TolQ/ExbB proton channel family protein [Verrucomicrobia bacterium]|nr:MAG: MotA/TolQ/ExbB proton channel family protein [Verrucomicrobiota bacterium]